MVPMVGEQTVLQYLLNSDTRHLKVKLAKNPLPPILETLTLADLTECDFVGYGAIVDPVFSSPVINDAGHAEAICGPLAFVAGAGVVPQNVYAMFITIHDGILPEGLVWVERLPMPVTMDTPGQAIIKKIRMMVADRAT